MLNKPPKQVPHPVRPVSLLGAASPQQQAPPLVNPNYSDELGGTVLLSHSHLEVGSTSGTAASGALAEATSLLGHPDALSGTSSLPATHDEVVSTGKAVGRRAGPASGSITLAPHLGARQEDASSTARASQQQQQSRPQHVSSSPAGVGKRSSSLSPVRSPASSKSTPLSTQAMTVQLEATADAIVARHPCLSSMLHADGLEQRRRVCAAAALLLSQVGTCAASGLGNGTGAGLASQPGSPPHIHGKAAPACDESSGQRMTEEDRLGAALLVAVREQQVGCA
jgi:hypothetical protein